MNSCKRAASNDSAVPRLSEKAISKLFATNIKVESIVDPAIRRCAAAIAEAFQSCAHLPQDGHVNIQEVFAAAKLMTSKDPQDKARFARLQQRFPGLTRAGVREIALYMRDGKNGLMTAGKVMVPFRGNKKKTLDMYALPNPNGGALSRADATKLAKEYEVRFGTRTGYDFVFVYSPVQKRLFVALNDKGSLGCVQVGRKLQSFCKHTMAESLEIVHMHDEPNSVKEATAGFALNIINSTMDRIRGKARQLPDEPLQVSEGGGKWWKGLLKALPIVAPAGAAGAVSLSVAASHVVIPLLVTLGVAAVVPSAYQLVKNAAVKHDRAPILDAIGVTTTRCHLSHG